MQKIFIFGSNGMLGTYVSKLMKDSFTTISFTRKDYDINNLNEKDLKNLLIFNGKEIGINKGDIVINCAGIIPQSSNRRTIDKKMYYKVNALFPIFLGNICSEKKARLIHITTDCVFSGKKGNYDENDSHDETSDYGVSKSLGELCEGTIIRTSIIGEEVRNKTSLLEWIISNSNKEINGYTNHKWNGVTCLQLSKIIKEIVTKKMYWSGVRHIFSPISVSKYELSTIINDIYKLNIKINKYETDKSIDKTLTTVYNENQKFKIPELKKQISELIKYNL